MIRILNWLLLSVFLLSPLSGIAADSTATGVGHLRVIKEAAVREGPAPYYKVSENLALSTIIESVEKSGDWYLVKTPSRRIGWISAEDVISLVKSENSLSSDEPKPLANHNNQLVQLHTPANEIEIIANGFLRMGPTTSEVIIANLSTGLRVKKLESNGDWYKIQLPIGLIGWANRNLFAVPLEEISFTPPIFKLTLIKNGNLRQNPDRSASILGKIAKGTTVTIIDSAADWYQITTADSQTGWLNRILFNRETGQATTPLLLIKTLQRNGNLREAPKLNSTIIKVIPVQTSITILDSLPDWYQVRLSDQTTGWVNKLVFTK